jgi:hypothetical protein
MNKLIGHIGVDAGLCWIGDPCYLQPGSKENPIKDWDKFCTSFGDEHPRLKSFNYQLGHEGLGVCVSTGGDGTYPVYAEVKGDTVHSVTVVFNYGGE